MDSLLIGVICTCIGIVLGRLTGRADKKGGNYQFQEQSVSESVEVAEDGSGSRISVEIRGPNMRDGIAEIRKILDKIDV